MCFSFEITNFEKSKWIKSQNIILGHFYEWIEIELRINRNGQELICKYAFKQYLGRNCALYRRMDQNFRNAKPRSKYLA